jgi:type IV conjugative transfer system pilin TraA
MSKKKLSIFTLILFTIPFISEYALAVQSTDVFSTAKSVITASTDTNSALYQAMLTGGLASAGVTGFLTKDWIKAGGAFAVGMIFMNFAMPMIPGN